MHDVNYQLVTDNIHPIHLPIHTFQKMIWLVFFGCQFSIYWKITKLKSTEMALSLVINFVADDNLEECGAKLHIEN